MKKNLFLLFCIYFFVVQAVIIGFLRQESQMFVLALINLISILLIILLHAVWGNTGDDVQPKEKPKKVMHEPKPEHVETHHYETPHTKKAHKSGSSVAPFIVSLIIGIVLYGFAAGANIGIRFLMTFVVAFVLFIIFSLIWRTKKFWGMFGTRSYIFFLILGVLITAYQFIYQTTTVKYGLSQYITNNVKATRLFGNQGILTGNDDYYLTGEGTVIGSGTENEVTGDLATIFSGVTSTDVVSGNSDEIIITTGTTETMPTTGSNESLHMIDMIKYLLAKYNVPLVTTQNISFTYMSKTSADYSYFRTAYAQKLIGSSTSPAKFALCDTYIVMKGLLEKWPVTYTSATVMQKFRSYAQAQNVLNGCEKGKVVKEGNL